MKRFFLMLMMLALFGSGVVMESCKNKKADKTTEQTKSESEVQVNDDKTLRASVDGVVKDYTDVTADVNDGVVTLRGSIARDDLQKLIQRVQELKPKKVENQLVIK